MLTDAAAVLEAEPDTEPAKPKRKPRPKLLPVVGPMPATRQDCPDTSKAPCPFVRCRHNLATEAGVDRPGRRHGGKSPPSVLRELQPGAPSCALDVVKRNPDGLGAPETGALLGLTSERVNQIADGARCKLDALTVLEQAVEQARLRMPVGARIVTAYPGDASSAEVTVVIRVEKYGKPWRRAHGQT